MLEKSVLDDPVRQLKSLLDDYAQELTDEQSVTIYDGAVNMHNAMLVCLRDETVDEPTYEQLLDGVCRLYLVITNGRFVRGVSRDYQEIASRLTNPVGSVSAAMMVERFMEQAEGKNK